MYVCLSAACCLPAICPLSMPATSTQQCLSVSSMLPAIPSVHSPCLQHQHSNVCLSPACCLPYRLSTLHACNINTAMSVSSMLPLSVCLQHAACHTVSTLCACNINTFGVDTEPHTLSCTSPLHCCTVVYAHHRRQKHGTLLGVHSCLFLKFFYIDPRVCTKTGKLIYVLS